MDDTMIAQSTETLRQMQAAIRALPELSMETLEADRTTLCVVDMVNGFARMGALQSPRVDALVPEIRRLMRAAVLAGIGVVAFGDSHPEDSPEFESYPPHCLTGSDESRMVAELESDGGYLMIPKNSTNAFLEPAFSLWLQTHPAIENFIVTGDCTDICVLQFAVTLKTWFNRQNRKVRVIVPENAVDTYDLGMHQADLMHLVALHQMLGNGVEVVRAIR